MTEQEIIYTIALSRIPRLNQSTMRILYDTMGSATEVFEHRKEIKSFIPDATDRLVESLNNVDEALRRAEAEMDFINRKHIQCLCINDDNYPVKLKECPDAPLVLFYCGNANLNSKKIVSMVGTRHCTEYGKELCRNFMASMKEYFPEALIVSGLAYGVDIQSHKAALENGMDTVAVLAHGLDTIYPSLHRSTAANMVRQGGLLTEYISGTIPDKRNFVRRNRIVAGISDATIVVESAAHGGALITAELANAYNRDVFAFPGRVTDQYSEGCNKLIKEDKAILIQSAEDFLTAMNWMKYIKKSPVQKDLFPELSDEEKLVVDSLRNVDEKHINQIVLESGIGIVRVTGLLTDLEMRDIVLNIGGSRYRLLKK